MTTTATLARIEMDLPAGFVGLPLSTSDERNAENQAALAAQISEQTGVAGEEFAAHLAAFTPGLAEQGVRLFGRFAVGDDPPGLATLTVAVLTWPDPALELLAGYRSLVATALAEQYRERHPHADARAIVLALGPAMCAVEQGDFRLPPEVTGETEVVRPVLRIEFQIPLPDGTGLAILNLISGDEARWGEIATQARVIAETVRIAD